MTGSNRSDRSSLSVWRRLPLFFFVACAGAGLLMGVLFVPGEWYAGLVKPSFNPPNWIFGPVWTVLYIMIALAGWRIWKAAPWSLAMLLWLVQMGLNLLWTPVFFGLHRPDLALLVILALLVSIVLFIRWSFPKDRLAAILFVPYAAWVSFASLLNLMLAWLNR